VEECFQGHKITPFQLGHVQPGVFTLVKDLRIFFIRSIFQIGGRRGFSMKGRIEMVFYRIVKFYSNTHFGQRERVIMHVFVFPVMGVQILLFWRNVFFY